MIVATPIHKQIVTDLGLAILDLHRISKVTEWSDLPNDEKLYTGGGYPMNKVEDLAVIQFEEIEGEIRIHIIKGEVHIVED